MKQGSVYAKTKIRSNTLGSIMIYTQKQSSNVAIMRSHASLEVVKTVLEVADVAWTAIENHHRETPLLPPLPPGKEDLELESLRSENQRLRNLLQQNLTLFRNISSAPSLLQNCPPDLHERLLAVVNSGSFLDQLENLKQKSMEGAACKFPFNEPSDKDLEKVEILINVGHEEPSWWVWVTEDMVPNTEEWSEIDNESYVVVSEEQVVDGVANFIARCLVANPKAQKLTPEQLQGAITKALGGVNKVEKALNIWHAGMMLYTLGMWGLALTGLYKSRAILRLAATGVHTSSKAVLKVL